MRVCCTSFYLSFLRFFFVYIGLRFFRIGWQLIHVLADDLKSVRDRASGASSDFRTDAQKYGAEAGAKIDSAVAKAQSEYNRAAAQARDASTNVSKQVEDARSQMNKSIDAFDKKVEDTAAKAKSGVSGWFGGK